MEWDSKTCTWNSASNKLNLQDNSYHHHLAALAGSTGSGITNMFSVDLKLGRFEDMRDMSMETALKNSLPLTTPPPSSASPVLALSKRGRPRNSGAPSTVFCSVDGCTSDLNLCREYHRRHKVCERHSKTPVVLIGGKEQRFCQQCSRFHSLEEFDEVKRSCRKRLDGHNRRRRKRQPETFYMPDSAGGFLSTHTGDGMVQFSYPQVPTVNWPSNSQPDFCYRNNQETIHQPFQNGVAPTGSRRSCIKVSPDNSGCALSLLSRYPSQSSDTCVGPTVQPLTMSSSSTQGSITALHLNNGLNQFSCSQSLEDIDNSASFSSNTGTHARNFGGFHLGHVGFREQSPRNFPFGWE